MKVLADRLSPLMSLMVDKKQTGFITGRSIIDGIATAQEVLHQCKKTKTSGYLLKIDFDMAYDMMRWEALVERLCSRGFGERWIRWIETWCQSVKVKLLINGKVRKEIVCRRGLRQGDPLSPLLFALIADALYIMISRTEEASLLQGLSAFSSNKIISLQYADDITFENHYLKQAAILKWILCCFEIWSGLSINFI